MNLKNFSKMLGLCSFIFVGTLSCKVEEKLPDLGDKLSGAVDIATSPNGQYFYVLNSDYERRYNKGSIVVIDSLAEAGKQKVQAVTTPRMGRSLYVSQNLMISTYADSEARNVGKIQIWDLTNEGNPGLITTLNIDCVPLNAVIAPTQPYFAVSCVSGELFIGKNPRPTAEAPMTMDRVRHYGYDRRALYFYEGSAKTYLFGFSTDLDSQDFSDETLEDSNSYDGITDAVTVGANGVPDAFESTAAARRRWASANPYQMFVYPLTDEEVASKQPQIEGTPAYQTFRFIEAGSYTKPTLRDQELHYVSYSLTEADGQFSPTELITQPNLRRYRTNFWDAKIGIEKNRDIFYLSQRGDYGSESNNVLRLQVNEAALSNSDNLSFTEIFSVARSYGFAIDRDNRGIFPGDFELANLGGEPMLLVNSFRDLIYYSNAPFYGITRKLLEGPDSNYVVPSSAYSGDFSASYYQLAVSPTNGKLLTSSFYGNVLYLFDANPNVSIKDQTPIRIE